MDANLLKRYGPVAVIALLLVVVVVVSVTGGDEEDTSVDTVASGEGLEFETEWGGTVTLREGVIPFALAQEQGMDIDWPEHCDTDRGAAAVPSFFAPDCFAPFEGDNGGATAAGVTEDTIRVVLYQSPDEDPILDAIAGAVTDDTQDEVTQTYQEFLPFFHDYYETYGREVELIVYKGSGTALDEAAARAAAVEIVEDLDPFAVWGGPILTGAFADELANREVLHLSLLGPSEPPSYYEEHDPYLIAIGMSAAQMRQHVAEYVGKRLAGEPAAYAGDEDMHDRERVFGLIYLETDPGATEIADALEAELAEFGVELAVISTYGNPLDVSGDAPGIMARMQDAGVTSILITGDPLSPQGFTREATAQEYFPEWILSGGALQDTAVYARTYDQQQWENAFGITSGTVRIAPEFANAYRIFEWYNCAAPPARDNIGLIYPIPAVFFAALQGVGPELTHEGFREALFMADPTPRAVTQPSLSWGTPEKGRWDEVDYHGVDDATELWWDPEATGPDEIDQEGTGMYAYVDGGTRYLRGEWPDSPAQPFEEENAVHLYDEIPAEEAFPDDYESPCA